MEDSLFTYTVAYYPPSKEGAIATDEISGWEVRIVRLNCSKKLTDMLLSEEWEPFSVSSMDAYGRIPAMFFRRKAQTNKVILIWEGIDASGEWSKWE